MRSSDQYPPGRWPYAPIRRFSSTESERNRRRPFGNERDAEPDDLRSAEAADRLPIEYDAVRRGCREKPRYRTQAGRFTRSIGADDGDGLSLIKFQINAVQGLEISVERLQRVRREQRHAAIPM